MARSIFSSVNITAILFLSTRFAAAQAPDATPPDVEPATEQQATGEPPADVPEAVSEPAPEPPPPPRLKMQRESFSNWMDVLADRAGVQFRLSPGVSAARRAESFLGGLASTVDDGVLAALCRANECDAVRRNGRVIAWNENASAAWQSAVNGVSNGEALDQQALAIRLQMSPAGAIALEDATLAYALSVVGAANQWSVFARADVVERQPLVRLTGEEATLGDVFAALADQCDAMALIGPAEVAVLVDASTVADRWRAGTPERLWFRAVGGSGDVGGQWFVGGVNAGRLEAEIHALASNGGVRVGASREVLVDRLTPGFQACGELADVVEAWRLARSLETDFGRDDRGGFLRVDRPSSGPEYSGSESGR